MTCYKASQSLYDLPFEFITSQIEGKALFYFLATLEKFCGIILKSQ